MLFVMLATGVTVGTLLIVFRRPFARFSHEMNSEKEIDPKAPVPRRYSPGWVALAGAFFIVFGLIAGTSGLVHLLNQG
ncbi:hypothetical protein [Herbiconiux sp. UC225_62]|uniref:hypothetical protein n=1 Tax=Herbiconiux sp. UC225_62 TaxID=3350168 RepID=UPI0036D3175D